MLWHGKNFRGFLNKASQVLFNKTGTTLNSTNVQDAICEINSNLTANDFGVSAINITSYTTDPYTFPADGYLSVQGDGGNIDIYIYGSTNDNRVVPVTVVSGNSLSTFVRKGMRAKIHSVTGTARATFMQLT